MSRIATFTIAALLLSASPAAAQWRSLTSAHTAVVTFDTIEAVRAEGPGFSIAAAQIALRLVGRTSTTTALVTREGRLNHSTAELCHRQALIMMARPGRYRLRLSQQTRNISIMGCELTPR